MKLFLCFLALLFITKANAIDLTRKDLIEFSNNLTKSLEANEIYINNINKEEKVKPIFCYYGTWAVYRPGNGKFNVENIDPFVCTHLVYAFAGLNSENQIISLDSWNDLPDNYGKNALGRFTGLKAKNKNLKTILAIGGWNEGSIKYSNMVKSEATRKIFISSVVQMLQKYNLDGLDLDWEYPSNRGGAPADKENYVKLIAELSEAFKSKNLLLTAAVSAGQATIDSSYDVPSLSKYLDYINVMAYDLHGVWDQKTGHNSPLYPRPDEQGESLKLNVDYAIKYWISKGAAREKIILGMGTYGRTFSLQNSNQNGFNAMITGPGAAGPYTREPGTLGFNELCEFIRNGQNWTIVQDIYSKVPYAYKNNQWVGFDDVASVNLKARYINEMNLAGAMIWSIETDDFSNRCGYGQFPLLVSIRKGLSNIVVKNPEESKTENTTPSYPTRPTHPTFPTYPTFPTHPTHPTHPTYPTIPTHPTYPTIPTHPTHPTVPTHPTYPTTPTYSTLPTTNVSTSTPPTSVTTEKYDQTFTCTEEGYFKNKNDCASFYRCVYVGDFGIGSRYQLFIHRCPMDTVFDDVNDICVWPTAVPGCENYYGSNHI